MEQDSLKAIEMANHAMRTLIIDDEPIARRVLALPITFARWVPPPVGSSAPINMSVLSSSRPTRLKYPVEQIVTPH